MKEASLDRILADLLTVLESAAAPLQAPAAQAGEQEGVTAAGERLEERAREVARQAERFVRENPWRAVGAAAGIAFVVGILARRR